MAELVAPHGGDRLQALILSEEERPPARARARGLKRVPMTSREASDVLLMAMGAYTPLDGFMGEADWRGVCTDMRREDGLFWPIPITLSVDSALGASIEPGEDIVLVDADSDGVLALMEVTETYAVDREFECANVFRTTDVAHPGVEKVMRQGDVNLAGKVAVIDEGAIPRTFERLYLNDELEVDLVPQGTLAERIRAGGAGIGGFYTPTGYGTPVAEGNETRELDGRMFVLELALRADFAIVKAWRGDTHGNLVFHETANNFNQAMAMAADVTIAEVEELVAPGELDPNFIHTPGIYVDRIIQCDHYDKPIEFRTTRDS